MQITFGPASSVGFRDRRPVARNGEQPTVRSSVKPSRAANDNLIDRTRQVWQPRLGRDLSRRGRPADRENVTGFFAILAEWSRAEMPAGERCRQATPPPTTARCAMKAETIARPSAGERPAAAGWRAARRMTITSRASRSATPTTARCWSDAMPDATRGDVIAALRSRGVWDRDWPRLAFARTVRRRLPTMKPIADALNAPKRHSPSGKPPQPPRQRQSRPISRSRGMLSAAARRSASMPVETPFRRHLAGDGCARDARR